MSEIARPRRETGEKIADYRERLSAYVAQYLRGQQRNAPLPAAVEPRAPGRTIPLSYRGRIIAFADADALALFGALAVAVDGQTSRITLASGEMLELTHQEVSDLGRQLAGMPADEVPGPDR